MALGSLAVFLIAFVVSLVTTKALIPLLKKAGVLDIPNSRSLHDLPTPRGGGIGIVIGIVAGLCASSILGIELPNIDFLIAAALVALIGLLDDRWGELPISIRLSFQFLAAGIVIFRSGGIGQLPLPKPLDLQTGWLAIPLGLVWIVAITNIYNFLDGMDGFGGLQGAVAGLGIAFLGQGNVLVTIGLSLTGACAGFLLLNWHPAKVFMGDIGSGTLGFLLAALPFQVNAAIRSDAFFVVAVCLWFFLSDGAFTLLRRLGHGERIWEPHRSHLYQRLVQSGVRQDRVVLVVMGAACLLALLALTVIHFGDDSARWSVIVAGLVMFACYYFWVTAKERTCKRSDSASGTIRRLRSRQAVH